MDLIFQKFTVSGFKPLVKALFRNSVDGTNPDPTEFIPFQETINGFAADAKDMLQILNCVAPVSRGWFGLNDRIVEIHITDLLSPQGI